MTGHDLAAAIEQFSRPLQPGEKVAGSVSFLPRYVQSVHDGTKTATLRRVNLRHPPVGAMVNLKSQRVTFAQARIIACVVIDRLTLTESDAALLGQPSLIHMNRDLTELYGDERWLTWIHYVVIPEEEANAP